MTNMSKYKRKMKLTKKSKNRKSKKSAKKSAIKTKKNRHAYINIHNSTHHTHYKAYDRKSDIMKFQYTPKLRGGKYIDKGGFGCVISPALPCTSSDINLDSSVSKIIKHQTKELNKELNISNMLKKLDPGQQFYITIDKYCFINEIPKHRTDLTNVKYKNDNLSKYSINNDKLYDKFGNKKKIDKTFCDIDLDLKPVNLIMSYAGLSLSSIMKTNRKGTDMKAKMHQMFIDNLKIYFKHLIIGLVKMHNNRIVNKDIKQRNIMLNWQQGNPTEKSPMSPMSPMSIRYIDFGLSEFLTGEFCSNTKNIDLKGTPYYLPPELFVCAFIIKYEDRTENYQLKKIHQYVDKHVKGALKIINEKQMLLKVDFIISELYIKIKNLYEKEKLLFAYFGNDANKYNGFLQKADVYALGLSIYETLYKYSEINVKTNEKLYDLLLHMIDLNYEKRYNIVQCLGHPYFTGKK